MKSFPAAIVKTKQEHGETSTLSLRSQLIYSLTAWRFAHNKTTSPYLRPYLASDPAVYIPLYSHSHSIIYLLLSAAAIFTVVHITVSDGCQLSISFNHNTAHSKLLAVDCSVCLLVRSSPTFSLKKRILTDNLFGWIKSVMLLLSHITPPPKNPILAVNVQKEISPSILSVLSHCSCHLIH